MIIVIIIIKHLLTLELIDHLNIINYEIKKVAFQ